MDADQLRTLEAWATGLCQDERPEVRAAAKAILLLVDEVKALRSVLLSVLPPEERSSTDADPELAVEAEPQGTPDVALRERLRIFGRTRFNRE